MWLLAGLLHLGASAVVLDDFIVEVSEDDQNETIISADDVAMSPGLNERYNSLRKNGSVQSRGAFKFKRAIAASNDKLTIELAIFTDKALFEYVKKRYPDEAHDNIDEVITELILAVVSSVQLYLNHDSLDQDFQLEIVHMEIADDKPSSDDLPGNGDIRQYLDLFCRYQRSKMISKGLAWDHAMLLTGLDLYTTPDYDKGSSGMAYLSGMCSREASCTISEARSLGSTALIVAHELAHNLGVDHDGQGPNSDCDGEDYIMGPKLSPGATRWSACSNRQMDQFISRYGGCLLNLPLAKDSRWQHSDHGLPGHLFDGDAQCHLLYGAGWSHYRGLVRKKVISTCQAIWCRSTIYLRSPNAAALQGTECQEGKHCRGGRCVKRGATTETTDTTQQVTTTTEQTTVRSQQSQIFFPSRSMGICQFFRQFGIKLDYCP